MKTTKQLTALALAALTTLAAMPARAMTWSINPSNSNQIVDNTGSWTLTLGNFNNTYNGTVVSGKEITAAAYTENGANGLLDLTTVNDDLESSGIKVVAVGDGKFYNNDAGAALTAVLMPDTIGYIGQNAFRDCTSLVKVKMSTGVARFHGNGRQFGGCESLTTVYSSEFAEEAGTLALPACFTEIPEWAFEHCPVRRIYAPCVTVVLRGAFASCSSVVSAEFSPDLEVMYTNQSNTQTPFINANTEYTSFVNFFPTVFGENFTLEALDSRTFPFINVTRSGKTNQGVFARIGITNHLDFSACSFAVVPADTFQRTAVAQVTLPATVTNVQTFAFGCIHAKSKIRFLGDVPAVWGGSSSSAAFYPENGTRGDTANRHQIIVDAETYPNWTNANFVAVADLSTSSDSNVKNYFSTSSSDYPGEDTLGVTTYGSGDGRYNWLVQYVDHSTVTATWVNDGATYDTTIVATGSAPTAPATAPTKESTAQYDYTFLGWNTDSSASTALEEIPAINADTTFYAIYSGSVRSYTISWDTDGDGTADDTTTVAYGTVPTHASGEKAPTAEYTYTFAGWSTDGETVLATLPAVTGEAIYTAVFTSHEAASTVTVRWFSEDGETLLGTTYPNSGTVAVAQTTPSKDATIDTTYTFAGWNTTQGASSPLADLTVSADTDFYAVFTSATRQYTVTFADYDSTEISASSYDYGTEAANIAVPANPTRAADAAYAYAFAGWTPAIADVTADATYTATYDATANTYTATFVNGLTSEIITTADFAYGTAVAAPTPPDVEGYTFTAWSPEIDTMPAADTTYTATYTVNSYTITWVNGNATTTSTVAHGTTPTAPTATKTATSKMSFTATGWTPEIEAAVSNTTYTARFTATVFDPITIAFVTSSNNAGNATIDVAATVSNLGDGGETTATISSVPEKTGSAEVTVSGTGAAIAATLASPSRNGGYEWALTATQTYGEYGSTDSATIHGRTWARRSRTWFENAAFSNGVFVAAASSGNVQVRLHATLTLPGLLPRALSTPGDTPVTGITPYQANAGTAPAWYCWNGAAWVKLQGALPIGGNTVELLGVVDFARREDGNFVPAVAWYADGIQLTTEAGDWEVALTGSASGLARFAYEGDDGDIAAFSGEYDIEALGTMILFY